MMEHQAILRDLSKIEWGRFDEEGEFGLVRRIAEMENGAGLLIWKALQIAYAQGRRDAARRVQTQAENEIVNAGMAIFVAIGGGPKEA